MSEIKRNLRRVVKIQPTMTADDNADNDVAFNWTKIEGACSEKGLAYAFSKQPTIESEYDIDYIAHKMVGDMIYGSALNQDASQTKVWGIVEEGTTAW